MKGSKLTHIDESGNPMMVDVSEKSVTKRVASAQAVVVLGKEILKHISNGDLMTKKGPVFHTAILAGVMGAKKTADLIPLAHPLSMEDCKISITPSKDRVTIKSVVSVSSKTGVEMEALTAVSIAALTVYDMCKAMSHNIIISEIMLIEKTGGKKDFKRKSL
ncbi:MAG: cyclic pyranopterin monophosphate synthase MoaC [Cyclobacteriaceae bacterium]|nr:cyclic pyranopterin monophosphate synthase MoaC [Cyclobacteriaceae bacterium]